MKDIITVEKINKIYQLNKKQTFQVWLDLSFALKEQETLGIVGESGCGKTTLGKIMAGIIPPNNGDVLYNQQKINAKQQLDIQMIFQDPYSSMNPNMNIANIIAEGLFIQKRFTQKERMAIVDDILEKVGLHKSVKDRLPHEFSGGQLQRINIARSLVLKPKVVILDEPTSSLDVSVQSQMINLLKDIQIEEKLTYVFISHNLNVIRYLCDRVMVMYLGRIVEIASNEELFQHPQHPYTKLLLQAALNLEINDNADIQVIENTDTQTGCPFYHRCPIAFAKCQTMPNLTQTQEGHLVACHACQK